MKIMHQEELEYSKKKSYQFQNYFDKNYFKKMKLKAYQRIKVKREDSSFLDSHLKVVSEISD